MKRTDLVSCFFEGMLGLPVLTNDVLHFCYQGLYLSV
jgi:hypothetical protein